MCPLHRRVLVRGKNLSKVKCFRYGKFGHYSTQCPRRKNKQDKQEKLDQAATHAEIDRLSSRLEKDFAMFADIPPRVRWVTWCCSPKELQRLGRVLEEFTS